MCTRRQQKTGEENQEASSPSSSSSSSSLFHSSIYAAKREAAPEKHFSSYCALAFEPCCVKNKKKNYERKEIIKWMWEVKKSYSNCVRFKNRRQSVLSQSNAYLFSLDYLNPLSAELAISVFVKLIWNVVRVLKQKGPQDRTKFHE